MTAPLERDRAIVRAAPARAVRGLPYVIAVVDLAMIASAVTLAILGRAQMTMFESGQIKEALGIAGPLTVWVWLLSIALAGGYERAVFGNGPDEYRRVWHASLWAAGLTGVGCYFAKFPLSRGYFLLLFVIGVPALLLGRRLVRWLLHRARQRGHLQVRVLVSGTPAHVDEVTGVLHRESWLGYSVVGAVAPVDAYVEETATGVPVLGRSDDLVAIARDAGADVIFFAAGSLGSGEEMKEMLWALEEHDISVVVAPSMNDISTDRLNMRPVGGLPLIHVEGPRWANASRLGKRSFDIAGSIALMIALAPLLVTAALTVWINDRGPVVFRQTRVGRHGDFFGCFKLRTMVVDAEARLAELHAEAGYTGGLFKMADDPRVTRPGRLLRRFSVDEFPQLWNVLRGEMSLVGPRPPLPSEVAQYEGGMHRRLHVRPGMTGLWQVSGRSDLSFDEAIRLDLYYVDNWSMVQDLAILAKTLGAVLRRRGAY